MVDGRTREAKEGKVRRERQKFGQARLRMDIPQSIRDRLDKAGLVPRWANDDNHGSRIMDLQDRGYKFVDAEEGDRIGNRMIDANNHIVINVGTHKDGSRKDAFLMATPKEYYEEDAQAKEAINRQVDDSIRSGSPKGSQSLNIPSEQGGVYVKDAKIT
jgi:hypothetical protein